LAAESSFRAAAIDQKGSYAMTGDLSGTPALLSGWF